MLRGRRKGSQTLKNKMKLRKLSKSKDSSLQLTYDELKMKAYR